MSGRASLDQQRLAFGRVAELYHRARPTYPTAVVDAVIEHAGLAPPMRILEVGAGTGKATVLFAERGLGVLALEPSPEMAELARANCAAFAAVEVVEAEFEDWPAPEQFPALVSAASWHWIDPRIRYAKAHEALVAGGTLAATWTFPDWPRCRLRQSISNAYRVRAPELAAEFPMHPDSEPTRLAGDWRTEVAGSGGFSAPEIRSYPWWQSYTSADYCLLLQTHQDHILLGDERRAELLAGIAEAIDGAGGALELPLVTYLCLARGN